MGMKIINGIVIHYRDFSTDMGVLNEVFTEDSYKIGDISSGSTVIDIGAHIGTFAVRCAKERNCIVYSYEPFIDSYKLLLDNIKSNGVGNGVDTVVRPFNMAVSDKSGIRELCVEKRHFAGSSFYMKYMQNFDKTLNVNCTTLVDIFKDNNIKNCDVLKIDCEGEEKNILLDKNSLGILEKGLVKKIILEFHCPQDGNDIVNYLKSNIGFQVIRNDEYRSGRGMIYAVKI